MATCQRRRSEEGVRGVGVGGDAAADAGARRSWPLRAVDGAVAHRAEPRRCHAGGDQFLIHWAREGKRLSICGEDSIFDPKMLWGVNDNRVLDS